MNTNNNKNDFSTKTTKIQIPNSLGLDAMASNVNFLERVAYYPGNTPPSFDLNKEFNKYV